jgi:four helix bundle protein
MGDDRWGLPGGHPNSKRIVEALSDTGGEEARGMAVKSYHELTAWQKAMDLVEAIYLATRTFPATEVYGLTSQMRRAAVSVPSNIAEGQGRGSARELHHALTIAQGSVCEVETQILITARLGFLPALDTARLIAQSNEVGRLIRGLSKSLRPKDITSN